jgi:hypothetical protein
MTTPPGALEGREATLRNGPPGASLSLGTSGPDAAPAMLPTWSSSSHPELDGSIYHGFLQRAGRAADECAAGPILYGTCTRCDETWKKASYGPQPAGHLARTRQGMWGTEDSAA